MATRHHIRQAVISLLYANDMGSCDKEFIDEFLLEKKIKNERKTQTLEILNGILSKRDTLDSFIKPFLKDGDIDRVGLVERAILRLGVYEIKFNNNDKAVVINEAVELAKELGGDSSPKFINAILDKF